MFTIPIIIAAVVAFVVIFFLASYVKSPPDTAFIISGAGKRKTIAGRAAFRIPFLQRIDKLLLKLISIDVKTSSSVPTADYINITVDSVVNVKVGTSPEMIERAAQNFLNQDTNYIAKVAREVLEGNMREIVGQMKLKDMVSDRQQFATLVKENASPDLAAMGLEIIAFNVQNFIDGNGVIENLGVDNISQISKTAAIAKANADKEVAVAQAAAMKEANDAKVAAQTEIEKRNNELMLQKAELKKMADIEWAKTEAAKEIEAEAQRKTKEIAEADANLARQEKAIILQEREVEITKRRLEAEIEKKAEAEKKAAQARADGQLYTAQRAAEAELFQRQKKAEAAAIEEQKAAEAERFAAEQDAAAKMALAAAIEAQGRAEAEAARAKGEAEAKAIEAKLLAEAEGLLKKAEALEKYGDAAREQQKLDVVKVLFEQYPAIAQAIGEGYAGVDKIVMLGGESNQLAGNMMNTITQVQEGLGASLGIDLKSLLSGMFGAKLIGNNGVTVNVEDTAE
jgi:flotillin